MNLQSQRRTAADRLIFLALLALPGLVLIRTLMSGGIPLFMDPMLYFYPLRVQAARIIAAGEWPLWNRCIMGGMPLLSNPQAAVVYPLNWPSLLWPGGFWFTFPQVFQLGLYGALTAWALRRMGAGRWGAAWTGALAIAGDYGWSRLQFGNYLNILPWWPLWIGAAECFVIRNSNQEELTTETERRGDDDERNSNFEFRMSKFSSRTIFVPLLLGSLAVAMPILGGAHQPAIYGLAALSVYSIIQILFDRGARVRRLLFLILTFLIGGLLAAPGWLPQANFLRETSRAEALTAEQALEGSIGNVRQLAIAFVGDWDAAFQDRAPAAPRRYADAESQAAIGALALLLALIPPAAGSRRRAWAGLLIAGLASGSMALRPVAATLFQALPQSGMFHDPRRWLGIAQWLLLMAAGLGADRLLGLLRGRLGKGVAALALISAIAFQGWMTWRSTEWRSIPASGLTDPHPAPLIAGAGLHPGERFIGIDWERQSSYEYRRPDLTDWALPNLGMLWGYEDLGGYEPGQSQRWRAYMEQLVAEPWRRIWEQHFSLPTDPWRSDLLDQANVRAAIFPRFGIPLYFRPQPLAKTWAAMLPRFEPGRLSVVALLLNADGADIALRPTMERQAELLSPPHPVSLRDDQIIGATTSTLARSAPFGQAWISSANTTLPYGSILRSVGSPWTIELHGKIAPGVDLIDVFAWNDQLARLWVPAEIRMLAARMDYRGAPSRERWIQGAGKVVRETIRNNSLELEVDVASAPAALVVSDAWWRGWEAHLADGSPLPISPAGPWRGIVLPQGRSVVTMDYHPEGLRLAINLMLAGFVLLLIAAWIGARWRGPERPEAPKAIAPPNSENESPAAASESLPSAP